MMEEMFYHLPLAFYLATRVIFGQKYYTPALQ